MEALGLLLRHSLFVSHTCLDARSTLCALSVGSSNRLKWMFSASVTEFCRPMCVCVGGARKPWNEMRCRDYVWQGLCKIMCFPSFWHPVNILTVFVTTAWLWRSKHGCHPSQVTCHASIRCHSGFGQVKILRPEEKNGNSHPASLCKLFKNAPFNLSDAIR